MQTTITVSEALNRLRAFHPFSVQRAIDYLSDQSECLQVLTWYQRYFPEEYANSEAAVGEAGYCAREIEFFQLVNKRLFPIALWVLEDYSDQEYERYSYIPIEPLGFSLESDEEIDELKLPLQVLVLLIRGTDSALVWDEILSQISPSVPRPRTIETKRGSYQMNWDKFSALCQRAEGLIADVPLVVDMLYHNTGNFWLDMSYDNMYTIDWSPENIDSLTAEYRLAEPLIEKFNHVTDELSAHPEGLAQMIRIWNLSLERQKKGR